MQANLVLLAKNGKHRSFNLPSSVTVIGRRRNCDLRIPLESISRRHCQFSCEGETLKVRDLGSRNGTFVNGKRVDQEAALGPGDFIKVGPVLFALQIDGRPEQISVSGAKGSPGKGQASVSEAQATASEDDFGDLDGLEDLQGLGDVDLSLEDLEKL